jgi:nucleoside-diphosphate-sugar epimerase
MKILLTGGSSFTGFWFGKELTAAGHDVTVSFRSSLESYEDTRRKRIDALSCLCRPVFNTSFGDDRFVDLIAEGWDVLCHHGAEVADYKSSDFNVIAAVNKNTLRLPLVIATLEKCGCERIVLTGSVFESDEGSGTAPLKAFSPYGLSKSLTWQMFRYYAQARQMRLGKFVIPNPFGPYEEPRFTYYLIKTWFSGQAAAVKTPNYVRDNIHVSLLAKAYVHFTETLAADVSRTNPSGYAETNRAFAERVAKEIRQRLGIECRLALETQTDFSEPIVRINTDPLDPQSLGWSEKPAWDALANYYRSAFS